MNNEQNYLTNLWGIISTADYKLTSEERIALEKVVKAEDVLVEGLDEKQREQLDIFRQAEDDLQTISLEEAFKRGVRFATKFIFEAMK